jgi:hypothetical protein
MKNHEIKKQILNKINSSKSVWVFNGFTEYYFKTTKSDILGVFRKSLKSYQTPHDNYYTSFLNDFNERVRLNEESELFFD